MPKVACPCCDTIQLSAIPVETIQRAGEAGMSIQDLLTNALKAPLYLLCERYSEEGLYQPRWAYRTDSRSSERSHRCLCA